MVECPSGKQAGVFMRFTIRDLLMLTVIVALIAALIIERQSRRNERLVTVNWTSEEEREWTKERFKAAKAEFEQTKAQNSFGRGLDLESTCGAIERFARSAEELPADPETRVKELEAALAYAKDREAQSRDKFEQGSEPQFYLNRTQFTRAEVETLLKRVQRELVLERSRK